MFSSSAAVFHGFQYLFTDSMGQFLDVILIFPVCAVGPRKLVNTNDTAVVRYSVGTINDKL